MSLILAAEESTSVTKAVLFNARGNVLHKVARYHRQIYPQPRWDEIAKGNRTRLAKLTSVSGVL